MVEMSRPHTALDFALLGGLGTLVTHEIAYAPASVTKVAIAHSHLPLLWALAAPLALAGVGLYLVRSLRGRPGCFGVNARHLAVTMGLGFTGMELAERAANGVSVSGFVAEPVMWIGLVVTPIVALVLAQLVNTAVEAITRWVALPENQVFITVPAVVRSRPAGSIDLVSILGYSQNRRGPPRRIVA